TFDDLEWMSAIPRDSFWWRLRDWAVENLREEDFKEMFKGSGRPSVSPIHTFLALLIQLKKGYSDREMEEESRYDDRVKLALLASRNFKGIDAATLCVHRKRFLEHGAANQFFELVLASAKEKGLFYKDNLHIVDSFMIHGAAAVQDTYTLIRKGILRALRIARLHGLEEPLRATLRRTDYDEPGKPKIDWDDPEARRQLLEELVHDALRLVETARCLCQRKVGPFDHENRATLGV
ncbi:MAG: transposase, partial [Limnochordaceae bacterium]|nr:transposase [Limnochordaceae bacterium]